MICAACDRAILDGGVICLQCNPPLAPRPTSHRELATAVRRLKGLVLASLVFGIFVAPFAIWYASELLHRHRAASPDDAPDLRQLVLLRRIAIGLLVFWACYLGAEVASYFGAL